MFWVDELIKNVKDEKIVLNDSKTPSGKIHVGSFRGIIMHDIARRAFEKDGREVTNLYGADDFDPMDSQSRIDDPVYSKYMGFPLFKIPSPDPEYAPSFGEYYFKEFTDKFGDLGVFPEFYWMHKLYEGGEMNEYIDRILRAADIVKHVYAEVSDVQKEQNWLPFTMICEKCGRMGTTFVSDYDGKEVTYECRKDMVSWAEGCGHTGRRSPFDGNGKLVWNLEWVAQWMHFGVNIEFCGKDLSTGGGSRERSDELCRRIFETDPPINISYEFLNVGGRKMATSKGIGFTVSDINEVIPYKLVRFLMAKVRPNEVIDFDPTRPDTIPDLYDEYDEYLQEYFAGKNEYRMRVFESAQIPEGKPEKLFTPRFRDVANYVQQPSIKAEEVFEEEKGSKLTKADKDELAEREHYARVWLERYASEKDRFTVLEHPDEKVLELSDEQRMFLSALRDLAGKYPMSRADDFQDEIYSLVKEIGISSKEAFRSIYVALLGKEFGPRAAWLILSTDRSRLKDLFETAVSGKEAKIRPKDEKREPEQLFDDFSIDISGINVDRIEGDEYLSMSENFRKLYPSASAGYARITGVQVEKTNDLLEKMKDELVDRFSDLTVEDIGKNDRLKSYRNMYRKMGVDWHSRRPSPEALLRRIAQGKGLYTVNTMVDAYNLVVMARQISVGTFDLDNMEGPFVLDVAKGGEKIDILGGDVKELQKGEVSYFDKNGPYNLDYNYRDAERCKTTLDTKNIVINTEGVGEIKPEDVELSLKLAVAMVQTFCGGKLERAGLVCAQDNYN